MSSEQRFYNQQIKRLLLLQLSGVLVYILSLKLFNASGRVIFAGIYGGCIMTLNSFLLMWVVRNIFLKKLIALSVAVVVFKASAFIVLIYIFKAKSSSESIAFMSGVAIVTLSLGLVGFRKKNGSF